MQSGLSSPRKERVRHRHELRSLTYVVLDQANGGIVRNLNHEGIAVQAVAAVRAGQQLRLRFELPHPRLRIETRGEVMWSVPSGQCGIRFLDLSPRMRRRVDEWIFGDLLEQAAPHATRAGSVFHHSPTVTGPLLGVAVEDDGLILSPAPLKVIELPARSGPEPVEPRPTEGVEEEVATVATPATGAVELDWLSRPLSSRGIAWSINTLAVLAALFLFALVFLSVTRQPPRWPAAMVAGATIFVAAFYWGFFKLFGGDTPGARLARLAGYHFEDENEAEGPRFR
jgi:hypothetical protein